MRQASFFYSFLGIFIATAIVTLLGVTGVVTIRDTQLNLLLGAYLIELAAAVVALYRRTDFYQTKEGDHSKEQSTDNLAAAWSSTIEAFDKISDEIDSAIKNKPIDPKHVHSFLIRRIGDSVAAYRLMKVVTSKELEELPEVERDLIRTRESSMADFMSDWRKLKRGGIAQLDPEVREKQIGLIRGAKKDLVAILDSLQNRGIYLDDHYQEVRDEVAQL
jgi:hypothetical protein